MGYLDFELKINLGISGNYAVEIIHSPAGEASATIQIAAIQSLLERRVDFASLATARTFGLALFDALLSGELRNRYDLSQQIANYQGRGLRIKLRIDPPELLTIPWEFLYDSRVGEFLCLSRLTPIVRYIELPQPIQSLSVVPPLRILGMIATPRDLVRLDVAQEKARLEEAIAPLRTQQLVELVWLEGQTWRSLQQALQGGPWHIFHFIGHADFDEIAGEGALLLANEQEEIHFLRAAELGRLLDDHAPLRLAVLNACEGARGDEHQRFSSIASVLLQRGLPAVLAMQAAISDHAAIEFTRSFYSALAAAYPIDAAVSEARKAISLNRSDSVEWYIPVLYIRASDGRLWQFDTVAQVVTPTKGISSQKENQLSVLISLLQTPAVQATAIAFRTDFAAASEQIELLSNYKDLHDLLHNLEFLCYKGILQEAQRFPEDETAINILTDHELTLQVLTQGLKDVASRASVPAQETNWITEVIDAQNKLYEALEKLDGSALKRAIWLLGRVLYRHPTRINERLNAAARALRLTAIVQAMDSILAKLNELVVERDKVQQFASGIGSLKTLNQSLAATLNQHDQWQAVDLELRRIESTLGQDLQELQQSWPVLQTLIVPLHTAGLPEWVQAFASDCSKLEQALAEQNPVKIKLSFQRFRRQVGNRFYQVDMELKSLCSDLRQVGAPLASILQVLESTNGY